MGEDIDELRDGLSGGPDRGGAGAAALGGRVQSCAVLCERGRRGQHLRCGAGGVSRPLLEPRGHRRCGRGESRCLGRPGGFVDGGKVVDAVEERMARWPDHRRVCDPGNDRNAAQDWAHSWFVGDVWRV